MSNVVKTFRLAPMSPLILLLTCALLALPLIFVVLAAFSEHLFIVPALFAVAIYCWIWLRFRPTRFAVHSDVLEVTWPLRRRHLSRKDIVSVRLMAWQELRSEAGWCVRVGAGGLWGGFGWLWTQRRGIVQMYISRTDRFVWIERINNRPWLITPEQPEAFVQALSG